MQMRPTVTRPARRPFVHGTETHRVLNEALHPRLTLRAAALKQIREYFSAQGFDVGRFRGRNSDYRAICRVLMAPRGGIPAGLFEDLCFIDEMSTPDAMDALLEAAKA